MTRRLTRLLPASTTVLGPNRVEAIAGTSKKARDGHVIDMRGMDTSAFLRSGTILWGHDPDQPIGIPSSGRVDSAGNLRIVIDFADEGVSERADEIRGLVKAGIVRNLSIGFDVMEAEPLDPKHPRGGLRITRSELLEVSFVSVPADTGATVTARASRAGKVLSGANASALHQAHDLAERCRSTIADVLEGAGEGDDAEGDADDRARRQRQAEARALARPPETSEERHRREAGELADLARADRARLVLATTMPRPANLDQAIRQIEGLQMAARAAGTRLPRQPTPHSLDHALRLLETLKLAARAL